MAEPSNGEEPVPNPHLAEPRQEASPSDVASLLLPLYAAQDRRALAEAIASLTAPLEEDAAICAFLDDNKGMLVPFLNDEKPASGVAAIKLPVVQVGPLAQVFESGELLVLDSLRELMGDEAPQLPARRIFLAPLQWQQERLGIVLFFDQGHISIELYPRLADHIALALARLRTLDQHLRFGGIDPSRWLFDREWLHLRLEEEVDRAQRYGHPLTLLLFFFENLDEVAKSVGRHQTEVFLRRTAAVIRGQIRGPDVLAGYGKASMAVLMPETPQAPAVEAQLRVAMRLSKMKLTAGSAEPAPVLLLAAATCPEDAGSAAELVQAAESRLAPYEGATDLRQTA
jgi:diguanylate cyclase (GGDEF)-like protein